MPIRFHDCSRSGLACCLLACLILPACQHTRKVVTKKSGSGARTMESRLLKPDMNKGNPFDKEFNTASAGNRGATKSMSGKSFHTSDVGGLKSYSGDRKSFHTGDFAQAGKESHMARETSAFGSKKNRMGGQTFATKDSKLSGMTARQDSQAFREGTSVFKTSDYQPAKKSLDQNKRLAIEHGEPNDTKSANAYSDDAVKQMLNR